MYKEVSKLLLYSNLGEGSILGNLAGIFEDWEKGAEAAAVKVNTFIDYIMANEMNIHKTLDVMQVRGVVNNSIK